MHTRSRYELLHRHRHSSSARAGRCGRRAGDVGVGVAVAVDLLVGLDLALVALLVLKALGDELVLGVLVDALGPLVADDLDYVAELERRVLVAQLGLT